MLKTRLIASLLLAFSQMSLAQQPPTGGGQFQQIPPPPVQPRPDPQIRIERPNAPAVPVGEEVKVLVNSLRIADSHVYSEADLLGVTGFTPGRELTLTELRAMAASIADYYRRNGYFVAQAYLPPQDIKDGVVTVKVVEGQYGKISVNNQANLSEGVTGGLLQGLNSGDTIAAAPLESRLLLLSDIPGVKVNSTLTPGASVGTSDLVVDVKPGPLVSGDIEFDNAGNRYTGQYRIGGTLNINNPTGRGDLLSFRGLTSGSGLKYGRASYQAPVGRATLGIAYTALEYRLGKEFSSLGAHGTAEIVSVFGSYPLIRSRNTNLYAVADFDHKKFRDKVDLTSSVTDREIDVGMIGLHGNHRDSFGGGGVSSYGVSLAAGTLDIITPVALAADAATARSNGHYGKLLFNAARLQNVTNLLALYGSINGQAASKNLDISEKIGLGGMYGVRAYPQGEGYGDEGYVASLEARLLLPRIVDPLPGQVHLIGFVDTGSVTINKNPWLPGQNHRTLSAIGLGITWEDFNNFAVRAYYAHKLGNAVTLSEPDKSGRFWFQVIKYF